MLATCLAIAHVTTIALPFPAFTKCASGGDVLSCMINDKVLELWHETGNLGYS